MTTLSQIYDWFMTGKKPTQAQFWAAWGSFWNKEESIPQSAISNLTTVLNAKTENDQFNAHKVAEDAHTDLFLGKEDKTQKGVAGGYAPLNEFVKIANEYLNIVNDLVTGGATNLLSAQQGVVLQSQITAINTILSSDDINLDTIQELVDAIKTVETSLETILVNDLTTGGTTKALTAEMGKTLKGLVDALTTIVADKQTVLVAGTNIKTVNGTTLMGSGNLVTPDMDTTTNQIVSGIKTFLAGKFGLRNIANTFTSFFTNSNTVARTYTLPNKDGTVAMTSDIPVTGYVSGGVLNYLSKYLNATTLGYSRLFDNGYYFGIGTEKIPLKDITLGNQSNKEIGIEESSNSTVGRNLRIVAGRTINYIENAIFNKVGTVPVAAYGMASTPNGNIYIVNLTTKLYKQTGGTGAFADTGITLPITAASICSNSNNDLYIAGIDGDIYKQTNETGSFIATGSGNRAWAGLCSLGTVIYASVKGGDIYKQTGGTGAFVAQSQTTRAWGRMYASSTSIYVCVLSVGIYKQTNATGAFVLHSSNSSDAIVVTNSNDIFINITTDIYKQTNETGSFIATGSAVNNGSIWGMATHANGNVYAGDYSGNVFMLQNNGSGTSNLDGGTIQLIAGTGKGTGKSKIQFLTGQKTISGTNMQVETVRAEFDENGNYKRFGTPIYSDNTTALAGGLTAGMEYRTELGVKMEVY